MSEMRGRRPAGRQDVRHGRDLLAAASRRAGGEVRAVAPRLGVQGAQGVHQHHLLRDRLWAGRPDGEEPPRDRDGTFPRGAADPSEPGERRSGARGAGAGGQPAVGGAAVFGRIGGEAAEAAGADVQVLGAGPRRERGRGRGTQGVEDAAYLAPLGARRHRGKIRQVARAQGPSERAVRHVLQPVGDAGVLLAGRRDAAEVPLQLRGGPWRGPQGHGLLPSLPRAFRRGRHVHHRAVWHRLVQGPVGGDDLPHRHQGVPDTDPRA
mmetsp:Transcript_40389/g.101422  ORF Transcript_40389/g.101422 Transcript_40389/m.101422 type:complete len:265 (+) Transcript_40389:825-1619(+)